MLIIPALGSLCWLVALLLLLALGEAEAMGWVILALAVVWGTWLAGYTALEIGYLVEALQKGWQRRTVRMRRLARHGSPISGADDVTDVELDMPSKRDLLGL